MPTPLLAGWVPVDVDTMARQLGVTTKKFIESLDELVDEGYFVTNTTPDGRLSIIPCLPDWALDLLVEHGYGPKYLEEVAKRKRTKRVG
jgi:hypothetical protein